MKKGDLFPIASSYSVLRNDPNYRVQYTGEFRFPKILEFFISGAIPEGFQASHNMCVAYHIGKLVKVKIETIVTVVEVVPHYEDSQRSEGQLEGQIEDREKEN